MGSLSDYLENELLDHVLGNGAYSVPTIYIALSTADPTDTGSGLTEPTYTNYARVAHSSWNTASSRATSNNGAINFAQKTDGSSETITHFAIMDASSGGNMLAHGSFTTQKTIVVNNTPTIADTELDVSVTTGGMGTFLADELLDHVFGVGSYSPPTIYVGLSTADPTDSGGGITEPSNGYAREAHSAWDAAASGATENTGTITFDTPTGSWGTISHHFLSNALTSGDLLFYGALDTSQTPDTDDTVQYADGALDITLD
jgi:hypothetical protein